MVIPPSAAAAAVKKAGISKAAKAAKLAKIGKALGKTVKTATRSPFRKKTKKEEEENALTQSAKALAEGVGKRVRASEGERRKRQAKAQKGTKLDIGKRGPSGGPRRGFAG